MFTTLTNKKVANLRINFLFLFTNWLELLSSSFFFLSSSLSPSFKTSKRTPPSFPPVHSQSTCGWTSFHRLICTPRSNAQDVSQAVPRRKEREREKRAILACWPCSTSLRVSNPRTSRISTTFFSFLSYNPSSFVTKSQKKKKKETWYQPRPW